MENFHRRPPLFPRRSRGRSAVPPAGDLLHLLWRMGGGVLQSSVSNITHNLEVKDAGDGLGSALSASRQANLAQIDGWGKKLLCLFARCVCSTWCLCTSRVGHGGRICLLAHPQVVLAGGGVFINLQAMQKTTNAVVICISKTSLYPTHPPPLLT